MGLFDTINPLNAFDNPVWNRVTGMNTNLGANYNVAQGLPGFQSGVSAGDVQGAQLNAQNAIAQQQNFVNALNMGGLNQNQQSIYGQLQAQSMGQGPNPAQTMLAQNTGQNIQQQAALMASARGNQANPGLVSRQASQRGGNIQQQAVGQAANLGAQQQLQAQGLAANLATAGVGQQQTALSQLGNMGLGYQQNMQGALGGQNAQQVQAQSANVPLYAQEMKNNAGILGGLMNGIGGLLAMKDGGVVPGVSSETIESGNPLSIQRSMDAMLPENQGAPPARSILGSFANGESTSGEDALYKGASNLTTGALKATNLYGSIGGKEAPIDYSSTNYNLSTGGDYAPGAMDSVANASQGGKINGKAKVSGDSEKNDTVPAMLSPGEIVIPRSHAGHPEKIAQFLNQLLGTNFKNASKRDK